MPDNFSPQVNLIIEKLKGKSFDLSEEKGKRFYEAALTWLRDFPQNVSLDLRESLIINIESAFSIRRSKILSDVIGEEGRVFGRERKQKGTDEKLRKILPKGTWYDWYDIYTTSTESPLSYHIFSSLCILGAAVGRRVFVKMGFFEIIPNMGVILAGRTGIKKTSAVDIAKGIVASKVLCPIMSESITPSRLVTVMVRDGGHQFFYSPEFSNLMNRASYNDGLVQLLLRLMDCPDPWSPMDTQIREREVIEGTAPTLLGATTLDQIGESTPKEVINSGFMNRFMWILESYTARCFPIPKINRSVETLILDTVDRVRSHEGEMFLEGNALDNYQTWYRKRKVEMDDMDEEHIVDSMQRGSTHMLKIAALTSLACYDTRKISVEAVETAIQLTEFAEDGIPYLLNQVKTTSSGESDIILRTIAKLGGMCDHSDLSRRLSWKFNSKTLKTKIEDLREQGRIVVKRKGIVTCYVLRGEDNDEI